MLRIMHNASVNASAFCTNYHDNAFFMTDSAKRLKDIREKRGYTSAKSAAEAMGVSVATYIQHESGVRGYPSAKAERYAKFFRTTPEWLLYGRQTTAAQLGPQLHVKGAVAAGIWRDAEEWPQEDWETFTGRSDIVTDNKLRFGLRVEGNSMDLVYPPGTILECVKYFGETVIPNGRRVIVERHRFNDGVEATVKEYFKDDKGIEWLVPRSSNPAYQSPLRYDDPGEGIERIEISAIVVAAIIQE
jgi:transcriptional regulator with XRE-family HTH domain